MTLSARAIALQGIGAGVLAIALQGLVPLAQPVDQAQRDRIGGAGGGVVTSATISLSEWLDLIKRRAVAPVGPRALPAPPAADEATPAPRIRTAERRRREEEALLLLIG